MSMKAFQSRISTGSDSYAQNRADMLAQVDRMRSLEARAAAKSEQRRPVFDKRGQLSPRERLAALLDPGMPFLELYNMASYLVDDPDPETSIPGASILLGIGYVSGVRCMVFVDDAGINAGAMTGKSVDKALGAIEIALKQKLPFVHLVESAGADLTRYTVELWAHGGGMFAGLARLSAAGNPVITVLHGASTAGGAYQPGLSDYVIGVKGNGMAMLAGGALVQAATGEIAEDADLGGAQMHAEITGLVEYLAEDDAHGLEIARDVVAGLGWQNCAAPAVAYDLPQYDSEELAGAIPADYRKPYDMHELAARLVDGSRLRDFKPDYGPALVCLQAHIMGQPVGILGNNGPIDPDGATKATHFLQLMDQAGTPVIFLGNTTGYMVGTAYERAGMIKHGSKMIQAVTNLRVPKISLYTGASFGAGNYGMCGHAFGADFLFTWPNAMTGVMGGEQAALTMEQVARRTAARKGIPVDEARLAKQSAGIAAHFDSQSDAFFTSGRMLDMGMIDPRDSRAVIGFCLATCSEAGRRDLNPNAFGVGRA
ncbi:MAG: geranyl-CoA carboxylase beta subunit [Pseudophaeobacter arcticus]|jgi:geranyl-CoA carboxylase beta subunit